MQNIIYVACPGSCQIFVWNMNNQGVLKLVQIVNTPGQAYPILIHPTKKYLYVGVRPQYSILTYNINQDGYLSEKSSLVISNGLTYMTMNKKGHTLYCVSYNGNHLSSFSVNKHGLIIKQLQIINKLNGCHSVNIDSINNLAWVPCLKDNNIKLFNICNSGKLTTNKYKVLNVLHSHGPRHMVFHHTNNYAYLINELSSTINVFDINNKYNHPIIIQTLDIMPASFQGIRWAADIHITSNSQWLYCSDRTANIISCFKISKIGNFLSHKCHHITENQPRSFAVDSTNNYLLVAGEKSNRVSVYKINQNNGTLLFLSYYITGKNPIWIAILSC